MFGIADKALAIIAAALAVVFMIFGIVQTVRIDGLDFGFFYAVKGYKPLYEAAERDQQTLKANSAALMTGLSTCNGSILQMSLAAKQAAAAAAVKITEAENRNKALITNIAALKAVKSTGEKCPVADEILLRGFQ